MWFIILFLSAKLPFLPICSIVDTSCTYPLGNPATSCQFAVPNWWYPCLSIGMELDLVWIGFFGVAGTQEPINSNSLPWVENPSPRLILGSILYKLLPILSLLCFKSNRFLPLAQIPPIAWTCPSKNPTLISYSPTSPNTKITQIWLNKILFKKIRKKIEIKYKEELSGRRKQRKHLLL